MKRLDKEAGGHRATSCVSKLRLVLGLPQKELAAMLDVSREAIGQIERGESELSRGLAKSMSVATGIDENWLLEGDADEPMKDFLGREFSRQIFDEWWDRRKQEPLPGVVCQTSVLYFLLRNLGTFLELTLAACRKNTFHKFAPRLFQDLEMLRGEFGSPTALGGAIFKAVAEVSTMKIPSATGKPTEVEAQKRAAAKVIRSRLIELLDRLLFELLGSLGQQSPDKGDQKTSKLITAAGRSHNVLTKKASPPVADVPQPPPEASPSEICRKAKAEEIKRLEQRVERISFLESLVDCDLTDPEIVSRMRRQLHAHGLHAKLAPFFPVQMSPAPAMLRGRVKRRSALRR